MKIPTIDKDGWEMGKFINGIFVPNGNTIVNQEWDFIVTATGEFLVGRKHSFLSQGADVIACGRVKFNNGVLTKIDNGSGHYTPDYKETSNFLIIFKNAGIDIKKATLDILGENGTIMKSIGPTHGERYLFE